MIELWPAFDPTLIIMADAVSIAVQITLAVASYALKALLTPDVNNEGPRRDDLSVTAVQPGNAIPRPFGVTVSPGQVIAQTELIETATTTTQSAKGGPSVSNTEYTYSVHIAVAFSAREINSVSRIICNSNKIVYSSVTNNNYTEAEIDALAASNYSETYTERLDYYENTAVKGRDGESYTTQEAEALAAADAQASEDLYRSQIESAGDDTQKYFDDIEIFYGTETQTPSAIMEEIEGVGNVPAYRGTAYVVFKNFQLANFGNAIPSFKIECNTNASIEADAGNVAFVEGSGDIDGPGLGAGDTVVVNFSTTLQENDLVVVWMPAGREIDATIPGYTQCITIGTPDTDLPDAFQGAPPGWFNLFYKRMGSTPDTSISITNEVSSTYATTYMYGVFRNVVPTGNPFRLTPSSAYSTVVGGGSAPNPGSVTPVDSRDGILILGAEDATTKTGVSLTDFTLVGYQWQDGVASAHTGFAFFKQAGNTDAQDPPSMGYAGTDDNVANTLLLIPDDGAVVNGTPGYTSIGEILRATLTEWTPDTSPLIEGDHFEIATALDSMTVVGATFTRLFSVREVADMCALWRPITYVETGDIIKFLPRDGDPTATVLAGDYRAREVTTEAPSASVVTTRIDDPDLPREVRVKYLDINRTFSGNAAYSRLVNSRAYQTIVHDLPFVGTPAEAKRSAYAILMEHYAARLQFEFNLPLRYFPLEGTDIINQPANNDDELTTRLLQIEMGADLTFKMRSQTHVNSEDDTVFTAETGTITGGTTEGVLPSIAYVIDTARLTDDATLDDGYQLIVGVGGRTAGWSGATVYLDTLSGYSPGAFGIDYGDASDTNFVKLYSTTRGTQGGRLISGLGTTATEYTVDNINSMIVKFDTYGPSFSTLTDTQFQTGVDNTFAVGDNVTGWEIIQAQNVLSLGNNVYEFWGLRRGIRGTEWMIGSHTAADNVASPSVAGDTVVHLDINALERVEFDPDQIGKTWTFRAVTGGQDITNAADANVTIVGRQLIEFAPDVGRVYRDASDNLTATMFGRAKQATDADLFTLTTAQEDFDVLIYDGPQSGSPTLLRTIELRDTTALSYSAANQTTDFGSAQSSIYALVYQLDSDGTRGYSREVIL